MEPSFPNAKFSTTVAWLLKPRKLTKVKYHQILWPQTSLFSWFFHCCSCSISGWNSAIPVTFIHYALYSNLLCDSKLVFLIWWWHFWRERISYLLEHLFTWVCQMFLPVMALGLLNRLQFISNTCLHPSTTDSQGPFPCNAPTPLQGALVLFLREIRN